MSGAGPAREPLFTQADLDRVREEGRSMGTLTTEVRKIQGDIADIRLWTSQVTLKMDEMTRTMHQAIGATGLAKLFVPLFSSVIGGVVVTVILYMAFGKKPGGP